MTSGVVGEMQPKVLSFHPTSSNASLYCSSSHGLCITECVCGLYSVFNFKAEIVVETELVWR